MPPLLPLKQGGRHRWRSRHSSLTHPLKSLMKNSLSHSPTSQPTSNSLPPTTRTFVHAYGPKQRVSLTFPEQGRTKQSFKDECDINNIMRRYQVTGELGHLGRRTPIFGDFPSMDFAEAMGIVIKAREDFASLPSELRDRFANDPGRLLQFLENPANTEEAIRLGLVRSAEQPPPPEKKETPPAAT